MQSCDQSLTREEIHLANRRHWCYNTTWWYGTVFNDL